MSDDHVILGIHITDRVKNAVEVQRVFTEYGCNIKTRIGLHDVSEAVCSPSGIVLVEFIGANADAEAMASRIKTIDGVEVQTMVFGH